MLSFMLCALLHRKLFFKYKALKRHVTNADIHMLNKHITSNIISHQRNANENHTAIPLLTLWNT